MVEDITTNLYHFVEVFNINKYKNLLLDCVSILRSSDGYSIKDLIIFNNVQVEYRKFDGDRSTLEFRLRESSLCISGVMLISYKGTVDDLKVILSSIERDIKVVEYSIDYNKSEIHSCEAILSKEYVGTGETLSSVIDTLLLKGYKKECILDAIRNRIGYKTW